MRRSLSIPAAGLLLAAALPAQAHDALSYSHMDFGYLGGDVESNAPGSDSVDTEGFRFGLGVGLHKWVNFVGEYDQRTADEADDTEIGLTSAGFGVHTQNPDYQFQLEATYEGFAIDLPGQAFDDTQGGYGVAVGFRVPVSSLEVGVSYKYMDYEDYESGATTVKFDGTRLRGGLAVQLSPWWSFVADYQQVTLSFDERDLTFNEWTAGFRRYFPTDADRRKRHGGVLFGDEVEEAPAAEAAQ